MKKHIENRLCPKPIKVTEVVAYAKDAWDATRFTASKLEKHTYVGVMAAICCVQPVLTDNAGSIHVP